MTTVTTTVTRECCSEARGDLVYWAGRRCAGVRDGRLVWAHADEPTVLCCAHCGRLWRVECYLGPVEREERLVRLPARVVGLRRAEAA